MARVCSASPSRIGTAEPREEPEVQIDHRLPLSAGGAPRENIAEGWVVLHTKT